MSDVPRVRVVGNGMLARAFSDSRAVREGENCIFASGVSNSTSTAPEPFERERALLVGSLDQHRGAGAFVYFGTCAADVPGNESSAYVRHKVAMEQLVLAHPRGQVARLPQVAGPNASPYTLLSALCSRIKAGLPIVVRARATRNIIDVADVVRLVDAWLTLPDRPRLINVANTRSYSVMTIVDTIEAVLGVEGARQLEDSGEPYEVDTRAITALMAAEGITFDDDYLARVIAKYYVGA